MVTTWFQVLYSVKKRFNSLDDFNATVESARNISMVSTGGGDKDPRIERLKKYLVENNILNDNAIYAMLESMSEEHIKIISDAVKKVYDEVDKVTLSDDKKESYRDVVAQIKHSNGLYLNKEKRIHDDVEPLDDKELEKLMDSYNELKNSEKSLQNIVKFIYENGFQNVSYKLISGNDSNMTVPNDILVAPFIINSLTNVEQFDNDAKIKFYETVASDKFEDDEELLQKIASVNGNGYVDLKDAEEYFKKIEEEFPGHDDIAYKYVFGAVKSTQKLRTDAKDLYNMFGKKFTAPSLAVAIDHYVSYCDGSPVANSIVTDDNREEVEENIDTFIDLIFKNYTERLQQMCGYIDEYNHIMTDEFTIQDHRLTMPKTIKLWKDFKDSGIYEYFGDLIRKACTEKIKDLLSNNTYSVRYNGKDVNVIDKDIDVFSLMESIDLDRIGHDYDKIVNFVTGSFAKADLPVQIEIQVEIQLMKFLKDFFSINYKTYKDFDKEIMLHSKDYCYDATCNLIYVRDKFIKESFIYETLFYGDDLINESENNLDYFNKLAERIKSKNCDLVTYVGKYADMGEEKTTKEDSSTGEINTLSQEQINTLEKSADELKKVVTSYGK